MSSGFDGKIFYRGKQIKDRRKKNHDGLILWKFIMPKTMKKDRQKRSFWSKRRDSNPRSPVPEQIRHRFLTTFVDFLVLFSPKKVLMRALVRTVST